MQAHGLCSSGWDVPDQSGYVNMGLVGKLRTAASGTIAYALVSLVGRRDMDALRTFWSSTVSRLISNFRYSDLVRAAARPITVRRRPALMAK